MAVDYLKNIYKGPHTIMTRTLTHTFDTGDKCQFLEQITKHFNGIHFNSQHLNKILNTVTILIPGLQLSNKIEYP